MSVRKRSGLLKTEKHGIPRTADFLELRKAISRFVELHYHVEYDPTAEILVTVGGSEAIDLALRCLISPGDEVLIPEPSFVCYKPLTQMAGGIPVVVETKQEDQFPPESENPAGKNHAENKNPDSAVPE